METRNVTITLEKAREWFYSEDAFSKIYYSRRFFIL